MSKLTNIPIVDVFAGPGGLGEGFASLLVDGGRAFKVVLSVEMDEAAHRTLELRAFFRQFAAPADVPDQYYSYLRNPKRSEAERERLLNCDAGEAARKEAWRATLGVEPLENVRARIEAALPTADAPWVLIGGPPCQAYSMVGRARNKGKKTYKLENDPKHGLYKHYLQIIADYRPAVFVMENVKGLLSARAAGELVFERMIEDLARPVAVCERPHSGQARSSKDEYDIRSFVVHPAENKAYAVHDFIIRAENYGIPQARHRVILLGIRKDYADVQYKLLRTKPQVDIEDVIKDLPRLRSGISRGRDSDEAWKTALQSLLSHRWFEELQTANPLVADEIQKELEKVTAPRVRNGVEFLETARRVEVLKNWLQRDFKRLGGVCNHIARTHMPSDLHRYFFAACFGIAEGRSPQLGDFPRSLRPKHTNVKKALHGRNFADRFRVQICGRPSTTITSHLAKDGHYYIHYDALQCRSLTVREAARLQTFPDNYLFCGNRTQQLHQVGNAVPPFLAKQIASVVYDLIERHRRGQTQ